MEHPMAADRSYDEAKFTELLLYVARQLHDDPEGGAIKLNKVLWWAECASMRMYGRSISGAEYQKLKQGPAPRRLLPVRERLVAAGDAELHDGWYIGYRQVRLMARREPNLGLIPAEEKELVDQVIDALKGKNAAELSAESHEETGWWMVDFGDTIPIESAYLAKSSPITPTIANHARDLAARHGLTH